MKRKGGKVDVPYDMDTICYILNDPDEIPDDFWEDFQVDWDKMREKLLQDKFELIMRALGYQWREVSRGQQKLEEFFN